MDLTNLHALLNDQKGGLSQRIDFASTRIQATAYSSADLTDGLGCNKESVQALGGVVQSVAGEQDARGKCSLVNHDKGHPPMFFISVASKGLRVCVSGLESTVGSISIGVDSKWLSTRWLGQ